MTNEVVERYLQELTDDLEGVPRARRRELIGEIREHINNALAADETDEAVIRTVLDQLGDPSDIADEARERFGTPSPRSALMDYAALILLPIGGIVVPVLGWIVGVVLLWSSRTWTRAEKVAGTLLFPGGLAVPASFSWARRGRAVAVAWPLPGTTSPPNVERRRPSSTRCSRR